MLANQCVDVGDPFKGSGRGELTACLWTVLKEILFPECTAAQDAGSTRFQRQLDLLVVISVINACGEQNPRAARLRSLRPRGFREAGCRNLGPNYQGTRPYKRRKTG